MTCLGCKHEFEEDNDEYETDEGGISLVSLTMGIAMLCFICGFILIHFIPLV